VGDYILASNVAVERKTISDLVYSIYDGRIFKQAAELHTSYTRPFLMLEGDFEELHTLVSNPKIVYGALATIIIDYDVRVFYTASAEETAIALIILAEHSKRERRTGPLLRKPIKTKKIALQQVYLVSSLPGIGIKLATRLLKTFKTPRAVFNANKSEMARVQGIGRAKVLKIGMALDMKYKETSELDKQATLRLD
jgi:DNA excision repair protein ERCC-4